MIRKALLDDWGQVKELWGRITESRHRTRLAGTFLQLETYFANSLTNASIAFPLMFERGQVRGFGILHDSVEMALNDIGALAPNKIAFLRMLYAEPGVGRRLSKQMHDWIMLWAKSRGASSLQGYCNLDFPLRAYERLWGIKPLWILVGKAVE